MQKIAKKIPEERRDEFMEKLGFVKKPFKFSGAVIGVLLALVPVFASLRDNTDRIKDFTWIIFALITALLILLPVIRILRYGKSPSYARKNEAAGSEKVPS